MAFISPVEMVQACKLLNAVDVWFVCFTRVIFVVVVVVVFSAAVQKPLPLKKHRGSRFCLRGVLGASPAHRLSV